MTQREREQVTRRHLYRYAQYVRDVQQYEQSVFGASPQNETGIRGSEISDPTARSGIALAEPPRAAIYKTDTATRVYNPSALPTPQLFIVYCSLFIIY